MLLPLLRHGAIRSQGRCTANSLLPLSKTTVHPHHPRSNATSSIPEGFLSWPPNANYAFNPPKDDQYRLQHYIEKCHEPVSRAETIHKTEQAPEAVQEHSPAASVKNVHTSTEKRLTLQDSTRKSHEEVLDALQEEEPQLLLKAFLKASEDPDFLQSLPATTVSEILRMFDPQHFIDPYKIVHRDLHPWQISHRRDDTRQLKEVFVSFARAIEVLLTRWRQTGRTFGIAEYKILLNIARATGDGGTAEMLCKSMRIDGVLLDTTCWNHYFEARCWSNAYDPIARHKLRVIPYHMVSRLPVKRGSEPRPGFGNYFIGDTGLKTEIVKKFDAMVKSGTTADAATFSMLMVAMSREGDMVGVKSILRKVWDIDVDAILEQDDDSPITANTLSHESPSYPTQYLLFTVVHVFGSNNELPAALRIIDNISRRYDIKIDDETWAQLFEWTFVLSTPRYKGRKADGAQLGQLPLASVENLWNTMRSEPYNIKPTMPMYNRRITNLWKRQMLDPMLEAMRAGKVLYKQQRKRSRTVPRNQSEEIFLTRTNEHISLPPSSISLTSALHQEMELQQLYEYRDFSMMSRWVRLLMAGNRWGGSGEESFRWQRIGAPNATAEFWHFRPREGFAYSIASGRIQFHPWTVVMTF